MNDGMLAVREGVDPVGDYIASLAASARAGRPACDTLAEIKAWRRGYEALLASAERAVDGRLHRVRTDPFKGGPGKTGALARRLAHWRPA